MPPPIHPDGPRRLDAPLSNTRNDRNQSRRSTITWQPVVQMASRIPIHMVEQSMTENVDRTSRVQLPSYTSPGYPTFNRVAVETDSDEAQSSTSSSGFAEQRMLEERLHVVDSYSEDLFITLGSHDDSHGSHESDHISNYVPNAPDNLGNVSSSSDYDESSESDTMMNDAENDTGSGEVEPTPSAREGQVEYAARDGFDIARLHADALRIRRIFNAEESPGDSSEISPYAVHSFDNESGTEERSRVIGGVPLRRQNAIRRSIPTPATPLSKSFRKSLKHALKSLLREILSKCPAFGACPLYTGRYLWHDKLFPLIRPSCPHHETFNLENRMEKLMKKRQRVECGTSEGILYHSSNMPTSKRKITGTLVNAKRQKTKPAIPENECTSIDILPPQGAFLCSAHLSQSNKNRILDVSPSSFLRNGSCFDLTAATWKRGTELVFTEVCQESLTLDGFFKFDIGKNNETQSPFCDFLTNLVGKCYTEEQKIVKDNFVKALKVIENSFQESGGDKVPTRFTIPVTGKIIDFKSKDLRYGQRKRGRDYSSIKAQNDSIRLQLNEWLKLKPFTYLSETFLLHQLHLSINCLTNYSKIPDQFRKVVGSFCKDTLEESWLLTRNFESIDHMQIPAIRKSFTLCQRRMSSEARFGSFHRLGETSFTQVWNSELCNKLAHSITLKNSCLLNLQLNYLLFTVEVNLYDAINQVFDLAHKMTPTEFPKDYPKLMYQKTKKGQSLFPQQVTFLCTLNRKTGALEMQRARYDGEKDHTPCRHEDGSSRWSSLRPNFERPNFATPNLFTPEFDIPDFANTIHIGDDGRLRMDDSAPLNEAEAGKSSVIRGAPKRGRFFANLGKMI